MTNFIKNNDIKGLSKYLASYPDKIVNLAEIAIEHNKLEALNTIISAGDVDEDVLTYFTRRAMLAGNLEITKLFKRLGGDLHQAFGESYKSIVSNGRIKFIKSLISIGLSIRPFYCKMLEHAVHTNRLDLIKYLVSIGANIRYNNDSLFILAARIDKLKIVKYLASCGCDIHTNNNEALVKASDNGYMQVVKYLLTLGLPATAIPLSCLRQIISDEDLDNVKFLISLNIFNTAQIMEAISTGIGCDQKKIVEYLLGLIECTDGYLRTCFIDACYAESFDLVKYFNGLGVSVTIENNLAIRTFARGYNLEAIKWLVKHGANHRSRNDDAIIAASEEGCLDIVKYLVSIGSNVRAQNDSAIIKAARDGHTDTVKYLVSVGANIHAQNDKAFIKAAKNGRIYVVQYMVSIGINVRIRNDYALRQCVRSHYWGTTLILAVNGANYPSAFPDAVRNDAPRWLLDGLVYAGINTEYDNDQAFRTYVDNISSDDDYEDSKETMKYLVSLGLWYIPSAIQEESSSDDSDSDFSSDEEYEHKIDPYKFLDYLNDKHIAKINDPTISGFIRSRRRVYDFDDDIEIVCISNSVEDIED